MDKTLEFVLVVMSIVLVLYTAMIDPMASLTVAGVAILGILLYRMMFNKKPVVKAAALRKTTVRKAVKKVAKTKKRK